MSAAPDETNNVMEVSMKTMVIKVIVEHKGVRYYVPCEFSEDDDEVHYKGGWEPCEQYLHVDADLDDDDAMSVYRLARRAANS